MGRQRSLRWGGCRVFGRLCHPSVTSDSGRLRARDIVNVAHVTPAPVIPGDMTGRLLGLADCSGHAQEDISTAEGLIRIGAHRTAPLNIIWHIEIIPKTRGQHGTGSTDVATSGMRPELRCRRMFWMGYRRRSSRLRWTGWLFRTTHRLKNYFP
jgi:hypothetical protein